MSEPAKLTVAELLAKARAARKGVNQVRSAAVCRRAQRASVIARKANKARDDALRDASNKDNAQNVVVSHGSESV